ncbi:hypothetical protein PRZ48_010405 [Zasmidium cellare]|uniref:NTF2-like domain-containing protein n=1 Tax=Zasmidium cellare TaxID=395010 RepID=A0ABR0E8J4_ZASCE|nr:hypothetical protein PRZ48_010405 [Zasmidium cellare]
MRFTAIALASAALTSTALAAPSPGWEHGVKNVWNGKGYGGWGKHKQKDYGTPPSGNGTEPTPIPDPGNGTCPTPVPDNCITDDQANTIADILRQLISGYTLELALEVLTEDFIDYSSAVNIIRNRGNDYPFTVNDLTFENRAEFVAGHGTQPPIPFDVLKVWHGCDTTTVQWQSLRSGNGSPTESNDVPVVGLGLLKTIPADNSFGFQISELYSEFNSAAWLVNNGVFTPSAVTTSALPTATAGGVKVRSLPHLNVI